jgi:hypothetical protein
MKLFYLASLLMFIAFPAFGQGWSSDHNGVGAECEEVRPSPASQRRCWYNYTNATGTGNSPMLQIDQCENFSVAFTPDFDGADTAGTGIFYSCLDDTDIQSCYALEGKTLSNIVPVVYGADGDWGYWDIGVACTAAANCRVVFRCNQ